MTETIFELIARLGTTYLDAGPAGQRPGSVTEYNPPKHIAFHHTMLSTKGPLTADTDVNIRYTVQQSAHATSVIRDLDLTIQIAGLPKIAEPAVVWAFRKGECASTRRAEARKTPRTP